MKVDVKELTIDRDFSLRCAMKVLDETAEKCLFVVEKTSAKLLGSLTDGDLRRAILRGRSLDVSIADLYNTQPLYVKHSENLEKEAAKIMESQKVEVIPVINAEGILVDYVTWSEILTEQSPKLKGLSGIQVVIMAGGFGSRLEPFTEVLPKPLIPVNGKPIIEHIIDRFVECGVNHFHLTVNYKSRIMKAFFHDLEPEYRVGFIDEPKPLGTAGSLKYLKENIKDPFFVTNCDIIIDEDYNEVMAFHKNNKHAITLVGSAIHYQIPYGTCILNEEGTLKRINEKPGYDYLVNTGMYVVEPGALDLIPEEGKYHMTDLIEDAIKNNWSVGVFPVSEASWMDVGQWKEYQQTAEKLKV